MSTFKNPHPHHDVKIFWLKPYLIIIISFCFFYLNDKLIIQRCIESCKNTVSRKTLKQIFNFFQPLWKLYQRSNYTSTASAQKPFAMKIDSEWCSSLQERDRNITVHRTLKLFEEKYKYKQSYLNSKVQWINLHNGLKLNSSLQTLLSNVIE